MKINFIIIYYLLAVFVSCIMLKIYKKHAEKKFKINKNILKILIMSLLCFINNIFMLTILRTIVATFLSYIMFKWIFKEKNKNTIYYTLVITIALHIIDLTLALFLPLTIKNINILNQNILFKVGYSIFVNIVFYIIMTNKHVIKFFKDIKETTRNNKLFYIIGIIGLLICNFWLFYLGLKTSDKILNLILCITELIIFIAILIVLKSKYEKNMLMIKEEQLKQNLELYSKVASEYKELKHNLMNDLLIIKAKLSKKEQPFINEVIQKYKSNYEWVNSITDIPEGLQGLVFLKKYQAEIKKIYFNFECNINKDTNINNNFKLYEALGIIFDNAIEGATESKEKVINIIFSEENNKITINVMNTFNNSIDLDKIGNKNYSTKKIKSGIGLNYLNRQKNKFAIQQSIRDNIFITEIIINNTQNKKRKK